MQNSKHTGLRLAVVSFFFVAALFGKSLSVQLNTPDVQIDLDMGTNQPAKIDN